MSDTTSKNPPSHDSVFAGMPGYVPVAVADESKTVPPAEKPLEAAPSVAGQKEENNNPDPNAQAKPEASEPAEMSDDDFLKLLEKKTGKKVTSVDELKAPPKPPTAEEIKAAEEQEATEALEWALGSGKVKKDAYENAIKDKGKSKREIALQLFTNELQEGDKSLSHEECEERFAEYYCETEPEDSWKRVKALKEMNSTADAYLAQYSEIDNLPTSYKEYRTTAQRQKDYNKQLSAVAKELPTKLEFEVPYEGIDGAKETLKYEVAVDDKIPAQLIKEFQKLGETSFGFDVKPEALSAELNYHLKARMIDKIIPALLEKHTDKVLTDAMAKLKNARNPNQTLAGVTERQASSSAPPSHDSLFKK